MTKRTPVTNRARPSIPDRNLISNPTAGNPAVGYCSPPVHSQFKKGQSGNPRGRRKNSKNLKTLIRQALTGSITIREGEKRRAITKLEAVVLRQIEGALKGNDRAALATLKIAVQVGLLEEASTGVEEQQLTPVEHDLVQEILAKAGVAKATTNEMRINHDHSTAQVAVTRAGSKA